MKHPITKTLLALGCAWTFAATVNALPTTYTQGDFLLGFRQEGTQTDSVVVDLGPIASFTSPSSYAIGLGSTLSSEFGSGWATDGNVFFSLISTSATNNTSYVTSPQFLTGPNVGPAKIWNRLTNTNSGILQNKINAFGGEFTSGGQVEPKTDANAYANYMPGGTTDAGHATSGNIAWGFFNPTSEGTLDQGTSGVALNLIQITAGSGPGTDLGYFRLSADGNMITYAPGTVPEPSTYAAMALGALALLGFQINKARQFSKQQQFA